jgi:hypothetical protein
LQAPQYGMQANCRSRRQRPVTHCAQSANSLGAPRQDGWKDSTYKRGLVYQSRDLL